jgi:hypothetical protein
MQSPDPGRPKPCGLAVSLQAFVFECVTEPLNVGAGILRYVVLRLPFMRHCLDLHGSSYSATKETAQGAIILSLGSSPPMGGLGSFQTSNPGVPISVSEGGLGAIAFGSKRTVRVLQATFELAPLAGVGLRGTMVRAAN